MVATLVLEASAERRVGSSPTWGTNGSMRSSYSGNTLAFQAKARGSIPLLRSNFKR
jgi:hypothetical protein